jgi:hypothetical protein
MINIEKETAHTGTVLLEQVFLQNLRTKDKMSMVSRILASSIINAKPF